MSPKDSSRKKVKNTRSRNGCGVCRARHIRCDQTRPACERCSSTGRKCDGYPDQMTMPNSQVIGCDNALSVIPILLPPEAVALRHFQHRTSKDLSGVFDWEFWQNTILQFSMRYKCIRNMAIALSCLQGYIQPREGISTPTYKLRSMSLSYYASGIRDLNMHISLEGWSSLESVLACSILCVLFEWRQNNHALALRHLYSSLEIINQWENASTSTNNMTSRPSVNSPSGHFVLSVLAPMLRRMLAQTISLIYPKPLTIPEVQKPFSEIKDFDYPRDAAQSFSDLLYEEFVLYGTRLSPYASQRQILTQQNLWCARLDALLRKPQTEGGPTETQVLNLEVWRRISRLIALRRHAMDQPVYTAHRHLLEEALDLCIKISSLQASTFSASTFSAEISIVPPLYFIAFNARDLALRWKAVSLLEETHRLEGIWDSRKAALLARRAISKDEQVRYRETEGWKRLIDLRIDFNSEGSVWP